MTTLLEDIIKESSDKKASKIDYSQIDKIAPRIPTSFSKSDDKNAKGDEKVYDFYGITDDDKKEADKEAGSTVKDIAEFIDNLNRPFYAVTNYLKTGIEQAKEKLDPEYQEKFENMSFTDRLKEGLENEGEKFSAIWKGLTREEKHDARDIMRLIAPETLDNIEKGTQFHLLGIDTTDTFGFDLLKMDAASVPLFAAEILMDPLTYVPFGVGVTLVKGLLKGGGKATRAVASKVIGKELTERIVTGTAEVYAKRIAPLTNIGSVFKKYGMEKEIDVFKDAHDIAAAKSIRLGQEVATTGERNLIFTKMRKYGSPEDMAKVDTALRGAEDEMAQLIGDTYSKRLKMDVSDYIKVRDMRDIFTEMNLAKAEGRTGTVEKLTKQLDEKMMSMKGKKFSEAISKGFLEGKGIMDFSDKIARIEQKMTLDVAEAELKVVRQLRKESLTEINKKIGLLNKAQREEFKISSKLLKDEVDGVSKSLKDFGTEFDSIVRTDINPYIMKRVRDSLGNIKSKIGDLNKYELEMTRGIQKKSAKAAAHSETVRAPLRKAINEIAKVEQAVARLEMAGIREEGSKLFADVSQSIKLINKSLHTFQVYRNGVAKSLGRNVRATEKLQGQILSSIDAQRNKLISQYKGIEKSFAAQVIKKEAVVRKANAMFRQKKLEYYKIFRAFNSGKYHQEVVSSLARERQAIIDKFGKALPDHLQPAYYKAREIYDDYARRLAEGDNPLLKGENPLYAGPRQIAGDDYKKMLGAYAQTQGTKSFLKKRKLGTTDEFMKFVEEQEKVLGKKFTIETDAPMLMMEYVKKSEMAIAKHNLEQALFSRFGVDTLKDLGKKAPELSESLRYLYANGMEKYNNPILSFIHNGVYGKAMNTIKTALTIWNPGFHVRNVLGFPFLHATTAGKVHGILWSPANMTDAFLLKAGKEGVIKATNGKKFLMSDVRRIAEETGYFSSSWTRGDLRTSAKQALNRYSWKNPKRWMGEVMKYSAHVEDWGRYGAAIANLRTGKYTIEEALKRGKASMFDYNLINSPADKALQGIFGFYTFSRRNLPREFMGILNDPSRYAITARLLDKVSNREALTDEELATLNDYERGTFKIFGEAIDGIRTFTSLGFLPTEEAYQTLNSITSGDFKKLFAGRVNPLAGSFLDFYYSKSSFYGEEFGNFLPSRYERLIPEGAQKALGLTMRERPKYRAGEVVGTEKVLYGDPDTIFMIRNLPVHSRFLSDLTQLAEKIAEGKTAQGVAGYLSLKTKDLDVKTRQKQLARKKRELLMEKAKNKGAATFENTYVPKWQKEKSGNDANDVLRSLRQYR